MRVTFRCPAFGCETSTHSARSLVARSLVGSTPTPEDSMAEARGPNLNTQQGGSRSQGQDTSEGLVGQAAQYGSLQSGCEPSGGADPAPGGPGCGRAWLLAGLVDPWWRVPTPPGERAGLRQNERIQPPSSVADWGSRTRNSGIP